MALRRIGSRLIAENVRGYINDLNNAGAAGEAVRRGAESAAEGTDAMERSMTRAVVKGNLLTDALKRVASTIIGTGRQALGAVAQYERLSLSMESLLAREIRTADATLSMEEALEQAGPRAEELLRWIQQLAIESPFDMTGVAMAFKTAQAYNFTAAEAQRLTQVTIDFTAATGAQSYVMNQISLALGQIKARGKLAGQEILQLTNAGINANKMLQDMGYDLNDVSKGLVTADEFLAGFVETMERDFGGAAARQTETISGLLNSLGDIKEIGLRELFGPIFQEALPYLAAFTDKLQELMPIVATVGEYTGKLVGFLFDNIEMFASLTAAVLGGVVAFKLLTNAGLIFNTVMSIVPLVIGAITTALTFLMNPLNVVGLAVAGLAALFIFSFTEIQTDTEEFFSGMSEDLFEWGSNIILSLAEGMASAIVAVIDVLIQIGQAIADWLSPGSPPKLLPDIDEWGMGAMKEYLEGFMAADFGILRGLTRPFEQLLRSLPSDLLDEEDLIPTMVRGRAEFAGLVEELRRTGDVSAQTFKRVIQALGPAGPAMRGYTEALVESLKITEKYKNMLKPLTDELQEIEERRQEVRDQQRREQLEKIVSDKNAPALAKELAQMELREMAIKDQISAIQEQASEEQRAADEKLAREQALLDMQAENNNLLKQQIALMERLAREAANAAKAAGGRGGGKGKPGLPGGESGLGAGVPSIGEALTESIAEWRDKIGGLLGEIAEKFDPVVTKLQELRTKWAITFAIIGDKIGQLKKTWDESAIKKKLDEVNIPLDDMFELALKAAGGVLVLKWAWTVGGWLFKVAGALGTVSGKLAGLWGWLQSLPGLLGALAPGGVLLGISFGIATIWEEEIQEFTRKVNEWLDSSPLKGIEDAIEGLGGAIVEILTGLWNWLVGNSFFPDLAQEIVDIFEGLKDDVISIVRGWVSDIQTKFENAYTELMNKLRQFVLKMVVKWTQLKTKLREKAEAVWNAVKGVFTEKIPEVVGQVHQLVFGENGIIAKFKEQDWVQIGKDIVDGVVQGIRNAGSKIGEVLRGMAQRAWDAISDFWERGSASKLMMRLGHDIVDGFVLGLKGDTQELVRAAAGVTEAAVRGMALPARGSAVVHNTYYQENRIVGAENMPVSSDMDVGALKRLITQTIQEALE